MSSLLNRFSPVALFLCGLLCFSSVAAKADVANISAGQGCSLSVIADGTAPFSYQWFHDGAVIAGSTGSTYSCSNFQAGNAGVYYATVSNAAGSTTSASVTLALLTPLAFTTQPASQTVFAGSAVTFSAATSGSPAPTYQWRKNGVTISGATSASYVIANALAADAGSYSVVATNSVGSVTSASAVLTINAVAAPVFTTQPQGKSAVVASAVTFTATASGVPAPTYQWRKNGINIVSATSASYAIASVASTDAGTYTVVATNSVGSVTSSNAVLGVSVPATAPVFASQPVSQTVATGAAVTFSAAANGSPAPAYQWRKNGINIVSATNASYAIASVASTDAGTYTVVATNSAGSVTSSAAVLTVSAAPTKKVGADFNGDGRSDIIWQNILTGEHAIWGMNGTSKVSSATLSTETVDWVIVGLGDFNSDGQPDILWENSINGRYGLWLMNGTTMSSWVDLGVEPAGWRIEGVGDFNGDGQADIIWRNTTTTECSIRLMNGVTAGALVSLGLVDPQWHVASTGDFDGDGKTDILWESNIQSGFGLWIMNGTAYSRWVNLGTLPTDWRVGGAGDFNGDGKTDILWQNTKTGECNVRLMNGTNLISVAPLGTVSPEWSMAD